MISQTAEYALRAMVCLGTASKQPRTAQDISDESKVPVSYLSKILRIIIFPLRILKNLFGYQ